MAHVVGHKLGSVVGSQLGHNPGSAVDTPQSLVDGATGLTHDEIFVDGKNTGEILATSLSTVGTVTLEAALDGSVDGGGVTTGQFEVNAGGSSLEFGATDWQLDGTSTLYVIGLICNDAAFTLGMFGTRMGSPFTGFEATQKSTEHIACTVTGVSTTFGANIGTAMTIGNPYIFVIQFDETNNTMKYVCSSDSSSVYSGSLAVGDKSADPLAIGVRRLSNVAMTGFFFATATGVNAENSSAELTTYCDALEALIITG